MRGARNSAQHSVAQTRAHTLHPRTHSTATSPRAPRPHVPRTTCSTALCGGTVPVPSCAYRIPGTYLDGEGGELTTDATYVVAPASLAAGNVCLGAVLAHAFFFVEQSAFTARGRPGHTFCRASELAGGRGYASRNPGKSLLLSLRQRNTCALC